ncbi:MAG: ABC transporter ATP-binding protein [Anaerovoracaceae bacterium]
MSAAPNRAPGRMGRRGHAPGMVTEKPQDFKGTVKKLMVYFSDFRMSFFVVIVSIVLSTVFVVIGPKILGMATSTLFSGVQMKLSGTGTIDFVKIQRILLLSLGIYVFSSVFYGLQGWVMSGITQKVCFRLRKEISEKIHRMPMKYFESNTVGEVLSRITNDVDTLGQGLNQSITQLIHSVVTVVGTLTVMMFISPLLTLIAVLTVPVSGILMSVVIKKSQPYFKKQQETLGNINGLIEETFSGQDVVKAFNRQDSVMEEFERTNARLYDSAWKSQFFSGMMQPVMMFVGNAGYAFVAVSGAVLAIRGVIQVGDIQAFIQYVKNLTQPISMLAQVSSMLQSMTAAAERVFAFLDEEEETEQCDPDASFADCRGDVVFSHVQFGYREDKVVIRDFNASVRAGQTVAIVGPTGAGKTTIVKLLMRFYDVNSGQIFIDGKEIRSIPRKELRSLFGMVLQDTWLFKGTIMENIRYGRLDATDEEVIAAAKAANAHHFIQTLPGGYQMELNEEASNVSQGQKQLLTIARSILADSRILILDEATSSVDTRTEQRIQQALDTLMKGRTSFVIAHRLSTIRHADLILVMKDGDVVEQGTHDSLLAAEGVYAQLYRSQFQDMDAEE